MMNDSPIVRAEVLVRTRGIRTRAQTLRGLLAALRGTRASTPPWTTARTTYPARRITLADLVAGWSQGRARRRTIDHNEPLRVAVSAALGRDVISMVRAVPNSYRGRAYASAASAVRLGQAVRIAYGRYQMPHRPYGQGGTLIIPTDRDQWIRRDEIMRAIRLPTGWRWHADEYGPYISGPGVSDYHPGGGEIAEAIRSGSFAEMLERARADAAKRLAKREASRRERLLARISGKIMVTRNDARAIGACDAGISAWCRSVGIPDEVTAMPASEVMRLAERTGERRAIAAAILATKRALASAATT